MKKTWRDGPPSLARGAIHHQEKISGAGRPSGGQSVQKNAYLLAKRSREASANPNAKPA